MKDCKKVNQFLDTRLRSRPEGVPAEVTQHLAECVRCRDLMGLLEPDVSSEQAPDRVLQRIRDGLLPSLRPVVPISGTGVFVLRLLTVLVLMATAALSLLGGSTRAMTGTQMVAIIAVVAGGAVLLALSLRWQTVPGSYQAVGPWLLLGGFLAAYAATVYLLFPREQMDAVLRGGWQCTGSGVTLAIPAAVLIWLLVRRGESLSLTTLGATIGGAAGLVGMAVLQFHCTNQQAAHLSIWHGAVLIGCCSFGCVAGWLCEQQRH